VGPVGAWWVLLALTWMVGSAIGSFLNVVAGRLPEGMSVVTPASACPKCHHPIRPWDNLPILSWFILRGRCRDCDTRISARYPAVEAGTAVLWVVLFVGTVGLPSATAFPVPAGDLALVGIYGVFFSALLAVSLIDADHFIVPDVISLPLVPIGLTVVALLDVAGISRVSFPHAVFGAVVGAGVMLLIAGAGRVAFGREAMGMGDVKLVAAIGAWMGLHPALLLTVFGGALFGSVVGIATMTIRGRGKPAKLPFGPYLCAGALTAWLWGEPIMARLFPTI
jgi:leader peptidase (prepilin peptidase) / N-methyltransferase